MYQCRYEEDGLTFRTLGRKYMTGSTTFAASQFIEQELQRGNGLSAYPLAGVRPALRGARGTKQ